MKTRSIKFQSGYTLLLSVLAFMGISGAVAVGFTQQAKQDMEQDRYLHNKRVLEEAKRALLQYAYNYLVISGGTGGPGRLPCADTDNNGSSNTTFGDCDAVGRFPWAEPALGLNDLRDADGQRLWYTVSSSFATNTSTIVNSNTSGTLTVRTSGGDVIYDGSNPDSLTNYGIAAVIIAPGAAIGRNGVAQNRSVGSDDPFDTTADTEPGIINPVNYLDLIAGTEDNATVIQGDATDGFVLGSHGYQVNDNVNDQFILVTAEEVSTIAERAVLATYRDAIDDYRDKIWGAAVNSYRYPWLNAYADIADLDVYDVLPGNTVGRVPFLNHFVDHDSHTTITGLQVTYDIELNLIDTDPDPVVVADSSYINAFSAALNGSILDISGSNLSFNDQWFDGSNDGDRSDNRGMLISTTSVAHPASVTSGGSITQTLYFWDELAGFGGWEVCPVNYGDERDCARTGGAFAATFAGWPAHDDIKIRIVTLQFDLDAEFVLEFDYTTLPATVPVFTPADAANNARFNKDLGSSVSEMTVEGMIPASTDDIEFIDAISVLVCEQDNGVSGEFNIPSSPTTACPTCLPDGGSALCTPTLETSAPLITQLNIEADYYPEFPLWVKLNNWNDSLLLAYANDYQPGSLSLPPDCGITPPCLTVIDDYPGPTDNNASLLVSAGRVPTNPGDLLTIFEGQNSSLLDGIFAAHPNGGDDAMLILEGS